MKAVAAVVFWFLFWGSILGWLFAGELGKPCLDNGKCDAGLVCKRVAAPLWVCELPEVATKVGG